MALTEQKVSMALAHGVDTKTDPKQVQGKVLLLKNAYFQSLKRISKRQGTTALPALSVGFGLSDYNNELTSLDGKSLFSYDVNGAIQINKGALPVLSLSTTTVIRTTTQQTTQDSAINGTLSCFSWTDSAGGVNYSIFDTATNQSIVNGGVVSATGVFAKTLAIGSFFVIIFYDSSDSHLRYRAINIATPTAIGTVTDIATDISTSTTVFDATIINNQIVIVYNNSSAKISFYTLSSTLVLSSQVNFGSEHANVITVFSDTSFNVWCSYYNGTNMYVLILGPTLGTTVLGRTALDSSVGGTVSNITGIVTSTTATIYYEVLKAAVVTGVPLDFIKQNTMTTGGTAGSATVFNRGVGLASKAIVYQGIYYILVAYQSNLQSTYFLLSQSGIIAGKLSSDLGGGYMTKPILPEFNVVSTGVFQTASLIKDLLASIGGNVFTQTGVLSAKFSFGLNAPSKFVLGMNYHSCNAILEMYDGGNVVEHGFCVYPEGMTASVSLTNGGGLIAAPIGSTGAIFQYQYVGVYEWTDNQGQIHQSAPSVPITVPFNQTAATQYQGTTTNNPSSHITGIADTSAISVGQFIMIPSWGVNLTVATIVSSTEIIVSSGSPPGYTGRTGHFLISNQPISGPLAFQTTVASNVIVIPVNGSPTVVGTLAVGQTLNWLTDLLPVGGPFGGPVTITAYAPMVPGVSAGSITVSSSAISSLDNSSATPAPLLYTTDTATNSIVFPTLRLTEKAKVSLALYRTILNGTIFFRVNSPLALNYNDKTVDSITIMDGIADAVLVGNQQLYTTGEIENAQAPAAAFGFTFKNRAILVPSENQLTWWPSKQITPGVPVEFVADFAENIDSRIGSITAGGSLDDKIIFFGPASKFYVVGSGPNAAGTSNDYSDPVKIAGTTGCTNPASVIEMDIGLIYQDTSKGIWLLDRSLQEQYIGADVEAFNSFLITSAQIIPNTTQVRFTISNGTTLVYDTFVQQWSIYTNWSAVDSAIFQSAFTFISSSGAIWQETAGKYTDGDASAILISLQTAWLQLADVQGFQRLYQMLFLGDWFSAHTITLSIYTDFQTVAGQTVTIPWIVRPSVYQYRSFITNQKCESMQFILQESQTMPYGQGFALSSVNVIAGIKKGAYKASAKASFG